MALDPREEGEKTLALPLVISRMPRERAVTSKGYSLKRVKVPFIQDL